MNNNIKITDIIIEKFIPIIGALLFVSGLGYLLYDHVWTNLTTPIRLGLGFFTSFLLIGTGFTFSEKVKYFADVIIGCGILLFYGTLIYGSRTTELATSAIIPEGATIITALITTIMVSYFASIRKSMVILTMALIGAYITPFVIGQNDVWASNLSFNSYLIYFTMINASIFLLGKEIAVHRIIPINLLGLFVGTYIIYILIYADKVTEAQNILTSYNTSVILMAIIVMISSASVAYSAKYFNQKNQELLISCGYVLPFVWFLGQLSSIQLTHTIHIFVKLFAYFGMAIMYFGGWNYLRKLPNVRYQHIGAYATGVATTIFGISNIFGQELTIFSSIIIAYIGLGFAISNFFINKKGERVLTAIALTAIGGISAFYLSYNQIYLPYSEKSFNIAPWITAIIGLTPSALLYITTKAQTFIPQKILDYIKFQTIISSIFIGFILLTEVVPHLDFTFIFFIIPGIIILLLATFQEDNIEKKLQKNTIGTILISIGFIGTFLFLVEKLIPHEADGITLFGHNTIFTWEFFKTIVALIGFYLSSYNLRSTNNEEKLFPITTIIFSTILLFVNYILVVIFNEIGIEQSTGGVRAVATTIWWIILSIILIALSIKNNSGYRTERRLGVILLALTVAKIIFYDLATMSTEKKIIVLMLVGGLMMLFSYILQVKGYFSKNENNK